MTKICPECGREFETNRSARVYCGRKCSNTVIARERETRIEDVPVTTVWSCGGGVQSTAIAVLIAQGRLPKPDYAMMTDCGYEKQATKQYVRDVTIPGVKAVGVDLQIIPTGRFSNSDIIDERGHIAIPAFRRLPDGRVSKLYTHCNETWKVCVARRWMRSLGIERCENWLGISMDETRRARKSRLKWLTHRYPLIEMGLSREDCLWLICEHGWPKPPRTSCLFCPLQDDASWAATKADAPADWQRAIGIERMIQQHDPTVYLHRSLVPLGKAEL